MRRTSLIFIMILLLFSLLSCGKSDKKEIDDKFQYASFREIPGVTEDEIKEIEALQKEYDSFVYGMTLTTEAFVVSHSENEEIRGYAALFCEWLTALFDIPFILSLYNWDDLFAGLANREIDFSGDLMATEERSRVFFMTDPIVERSIKYFQLVSQPNIYEIMRSRPPRFVFLKDSVALDSFSEIVDYDFEIVVADNAIDAYHSLVYDEADAIIVMSIFEASFDEFDDVTAGTFLPLVYISASMSTQNPKLISVISVVNKALHDRNTRHYLSRLNDYGYREYLKNKMTTQFTDEEHEYLRNRHVVPIGVDPENYPGNFYDKHEKKWKGIFFDLFDEITFLTGMKFECVNDENTPWSVTFQMLLDGEALIIPELTWTKERDGLFLWPDSSQMTDYYALISKSEYPNIKIEDIVNYKVGLMQNTSYAEIFRRWFPNNSSTVEYQNMESAFNALQRGEIDMVMASQTRLLYLTNYMEHPGYKANFIFEQPIDLNFGINRNEAVLCSIIDKALKMIDTKGIMDQWVHKTYDYRVKVADVQRMWFIGSSVLFLSAFALVAVLLERSRRARKLLGLRTAMLFTIYKSIPDLLYSKNLNSVYTSCNPSFEAMAGVPESQIIGKTYAEITRDKELVERLSKSDTSVIKNNTIQKIEMPITYPDNSKKLMEMIKTPLIQKGKTIGILGIGRDITAHKQAQEAVVAASKAKGAFMAHTSHEIRTPLNAIIGMAYILKDCVQDNEKAARYVNQIMTSSHHLLGVLNNILDMSKIESGKMELTHELFSLLTACGEVFDIMTQRCAEKKINLVTNIHEMKDIAIVGDKLRLNQVLINLLGNAIKFTDTNGEIKFLTEILEESEDKAQVKFSVSDNGIGMNEEQVKKLFTPFEQADSTIASRFGGTGLGLSLSQNFVNMMGGKISVTSELNKGSSFFFSLNFDKGDLTEVQTADAKDEKHEDLNLKGKRILLAEDIEINRLIVRELLSSANPIIDEAENGQHAVDRFIASPEGYYDLIMMDIQMPVLDGYEAAKEIRALVRADASTVPIVAMTANVFKDDIERCISAGMNDHIGKPINVDEMFEKLRKVL